MWEKSSMAVSYSHNLKSSSISFRRNLWETLPNALTKSRYMMPTVFTKSTRLVNLSKKEMRSLRHDMLLVNPCWLLKSLQDVQRAHRHGISWSAPGSFWCWWQANYSIFSQTLPDQAQHLLPVLLEFPRISDSGSKNTPTSSFSPGVWSSWYWDLCEK